MKKIILLCALSVSTVASSVLANDNFLSFDKSHSEYETYKEYLCENTDIDNKKIVTGQWAVSEKVAKSIAYKKMASYTGYSVVANKENAAKFCYNIKVDALSGELIYKVNVIF